MPLEEFLELAPIQYAELCETDSKRRRLDQGMTELMLAQLTALVANFGRGSDQAPAKTTDFMPSEWEKKPVRRKATKKCIPAAAWARYNSAKEAYLKQKPRGA